MGDTDIPPLSLDEAAAFLSLLTSTPSATEVTVAKAREYLTGSGEKPLETQLASLTAAKKRYDELGPVRQDECRQACAATVFNMRLFTEQATSLYQHGSSRHKHITLTWEEIGETAYTALEPLFGEELTEDLIGTLVSV